MKLSGLFSLPSGNTTISTRDTGKNFSGLSANIIAATFLTNRFSFGPSSSSICSRIFPISDVKSAFASLLPTEAKWFFTNKGEMSSISIFSLPRSS